MAIRKAKDGHAHALQPVPSTPQTQHPIPNYHARYAHYSALRNSLPIHPAPYHTSCPGAHPHGRARQSANEVVQRVLCRPRATLALVTFHIFIYFVFFLLKYVGSQISKKRTYLLHSDTTKACGPVSCFHRAQQTSKPRDAHTHTYIHTHREGEDYTSSSSCSSTSSSPCSSSSSSSSSPWLQPPPCHSARCSKISVLVPS